MRLIGPAHSLALTTKPFSCDRGTGSPTVEVPANDSVGSHEPGCCFAQVSVEHIAPRHQREIPRALD